MLLSPSSGAATPMGVMTSGVGLAASGSVGVPLEACRVAPYVSPLRLHPPPYDRLPSLPTLSLDPALLSAAHQVGCDDELRFYAYTEGKDIERETGRHTIQSSYPRPFCPAFLRTGNQVSYVYS